MEIEVQGFVPYDESIQYRMHDAWFAGQGLAVFAEGEIPQFATCNYAMARQHARFALDVAASLAPKGEVVILEVGAGSGRFVASFLRALDTGLGARGRALAARLRYVMTDFLERTIREAAATPAVRPFVEAGRVVPAVFDMRAPATAPRALAAADRAVAARAPVLVIANYLCCVSAAKVLRKTRSGWEEKHARFCLSLADDDPRLKPGAPKVDWAVEVGERPTGQIVEAARITTEWRGTDLARALGGERHAAVARAAADGLAEATIIYPRPFLDFVAKLRGRVRPGGVLLVSDYGWPGRDVLRGLRDEEPQMYGGTINHGVSFALFDPLCAAERLALARTRRPLRAIQCAAIFYAREAPPELRRAFRRRYEAHTDGEDLLDFRAAARETANPTRAAKLWARCLALDPDSPETLREHGRACLDAGVPALALRSFRRGRRAVADGEEAATDWDHYDGLALFALGRLRAAVAAYRRSTARRETPDVLTDLARALLGLGRPGEAWRACSRALALLAGHTRALALADEIKLACAEAAAAAETAPRKKRGAKRR